MNAKYLQAVAQQDLAAALAALTAQIQQAEAGTSTAVPLARLYSNRAYWHIRLEYNRKALKDLNEALRLQPQMLDAQIRRGEVLVALNKIDEAVRQWRAALETATANSECDAAVLACIHSYLQEPEQAKLQGKQQASAAADSATSLAAPPAAGRTAAPASATGPAKPPASRQESAGDGVETSSRTGPGPQAATAEQELLAAAAAAGSGTGPAPSFLQAIEAQQRLQQCIELINDCKYHEAEFKLNDLLRSNATSTAVLFQAKVCLGTCKAQRHQLPEALKDFSAAIEIGPQVVDAWKRRSQVKGALGDMEGALADLSEAMKLAVDAKEKAALHFERGSIHHGRSNHRSAREDFEVVVKLDPGNVSAWNSLGHSRTAMGDIELGVQAYDTAISLDSTFRDAFFNKGYALKEQGKVKDAERALLTAIGMDTPSGSQMRAFRLLVHMRQCQGEHAKAIQVANKALLQGRPEQRVELLYLKAICHHALGEYFQAFQAYTDAASIALPAPAADAATRELEGKKRAAGGGGGDDALHMQYLSWYQREMAAYMYTVLDTPVNEFCIDRTLHPKFKEDWCRKAMPQVLVYGKTWPKMPAEPPKRQLGGVDEAALAQLLPVADALGQQLQNTHQGFVSNRRQQRAAGLAALELAQMVCRVVAERRKDRELWVKSQGASGGVGSDGRHQFGWRDAMDIVVRWRQLAEPNDQVVWVDLLSKEEFTRGFGSHTPMFTGQTQCVRYYMNFQRAFDLFRRIVLEKGHAFDGQDRAVPLGSPDVQTALKEAKHCAAMFDAIGSDCWVVVPIDSSRGGSAPQLEGTRLTLVRFPTEVQPDAYEFSIRTPVTPPRWAAFDAELEHAWARLNSALIEEDAPEAARWIMLFGYYWYNFMPLARGSAAVGYTTMLALFWVAGMPVTASIPADYQVDWEAILAPQPQAFLDSVSPWMWPGQVKGDGRLSLEEQAKQEAMGLPEQLPDVLLTLSTNRQRINALNHPHGPWV